MGHFKPIITALLLFLVFLPGCDLVKGIFQAGFWTAIILIILFIALIVWLISKFSSTNGQQQQPPP